MDPAAERYMALAKEMDKQARLAKEPHLEAGYTAIAASYRKLADDIMKRWVQKP